MAVCTLVRHRKATFKTLKTRPEPVERVVAVTARRVAASKLPSKLEDVEDRLLEQSIDRHPRAEAALDGALDDMAALSAELQRSRRRPLLLRSTTSLNRIEDMLLEAIVRTHPNRERALDRLMDDLDSRGSESVETPAAVHSATDFDMSFDNDFDGLG